MAAKKQMLIRSEVKTVFADEAKICKLLMKKAKTKKDKKTIENLKIRLLVSKDILAKLNDLEVIK